MTVDELLARLDALATESSEGTPGLSELDHGLQCAHELTRARPDDLGLQLAGLVHDIGHDLGPEAEHGRLGAALVGDLLGGRVAALVEAHVPAKRYLVTADAGYAGLLSAGSTHSLALQGGVMGQTELAEFSSSPVFEDAVALRRADDAAKVAGRPVPALDAWAPVLVRWVADVGGDRR
jgi:predicted HD phosphohydrolase